MELVKGRLFFTTETNWRASSNGLPSRGISLDALYRLGKSRSFAPPSIQSILFHCSEVDRRLKHYGSIVYTTNNQCDVHSIRSRTCSALFMGAYAVINMGWSANYTMLKIRKVIQEPFANFIDHHGSENYGLRIDDCLEALEVGVGKFGWFKENVAQDMKRQIDMNWIIPNKVIAMRDPGKSANSNEGQVEKTFKVELKKHSINVIVRLNKHDCETNLKRRAPYDPSELIKEGFYHVDIPFKDGGIPSNNQICKFLEICSGSETKLAVHCYAGLGRTGTMIACYLMYDYDFTSRQAVGWLNMCRRGSIMGRQHQFLDDLSSGLRFVRAQINTHIAIDKDNKSVPKNKVNGSEASLLRASGKMEARLSPDGYKSDDDSPMPQDLGTYKKSLVLNPFQKPISAQPNASSEKRDDERREAKRKLTKEVLVEEESYGSESYENRRDLGIYCLTAEHKHSLLTTKTKDIGHCNAEVEASKHGSFMKNDLRLVDKNDHAKQQVSSKKVVYNDLCSLESEPTKNRDKSRALSKEIEERLNDISRNFKRRISGILDLMNSGIDARYTVKNRDCIQVYS